MSPSSSSVCLSVYKHKTFGDPNFATQNRYYHHEHSTSSSSYHTLHDKTPSETQQHTADNASGAGGWLAALSTKSSPCAFRGV